jgi:hypothetical protein
MAGHPDVLTRTLTAQFPTGHRVSVIARYDRRHPFELCLRFVGARRGTDWRFCRDLLIEALLLGSAGDGDVRFRPDESCVDHMWLVLDSPDGHAELRFAIGELADLAAGMQHLVPADAAPVDWDTEQRTLAEWGL